MTMILDTLVQGLLLGGLFTLTALGLSLAFGVMRLVNVAHGDFMVLGAYFALIVMQLLGIHPLPALLIVLPGMAVAGYFAQRLILDRTLGRDILPPLLVTFGFSVIVQSALLEVFSADSRRLDAGGLVTASVNPFGDFYVGWFPLLITLLAVALVGGMQWLFARTAIGRAFRAVSDDQEIAQLMGINPKHVFGLALALASACVGLAGVLFGISTTFDPAIGPAHLIYAFEAVIIGGMGSFWGTFVGGVLLGTAQAIGFRVDPGWGILFGHAVFLLVLLARPSGLFPRTRDR
ncbi:MAG TPA: branched-chain amino acid ABC transporter permease [Burkholderiaceae bacterium]|nr:branched-chain amino acid ABC transporter permease [Burkholderiaceae bacterium]